MIKKGLVWLLLTALVLGGSACGNTEKSATTDSLGVSSETAGDDAISSSEENTAEDEITETVGSELESAETEKTDASESEEAEEEPEEYIPVYFNNFSSMADFAEQYGFKFGTVINADALNNAEYLEMVAWHFNSMTASNEMKAYCLLDQEASRKSANGMPVMNYETADKIAAFAQRLGIGIRGHVLVWDAYMSEWFFTKDYTRGGEYVDAETMKARLEYYIEDVITHFETNYPGVVYCWDVVNEAVGDGTAEYAADDVRHVRMSRNGEENPFYEVIGPDYVELSFLYAKNTVEKLQAENPDVDIKLFYNDYSTFYENKRDAICNLLESINSYAQDADGNNRKLCDGMGMQSYIGGYGSQSGCMNDEDLKRIENAILKYAALDLEVHVTEMAVRNYTYDEATLKRHAEFYRDLFEVYLRVNEGEEKPLTSVSIWGICDNPALPESDYSYRMNGPYCGLFTESYYAKESFKLVYDLLAGEE